MSVDFHLPPIAIPPVQPPVILSDPYRGSHVLRWNKSRGQPDSGRLPQPMTRESSFNLSLDDDDMTSSCTPYRLPRLSPRPGDLTPNSDTDNSHGHDESKSNDKVWSRYGYEKIIRIPELSPQIRMLVPPPKSFKSTSPYSATAPRFKNAAITPTVRAVPWNMGREIDDSHLQLYQSNHSRVHDDDYSSRHTRLEPTPTPISRSESPAKSVKSIHWILGHNRYHTFDKKVSRYGGRLRRKFLLFIIKCRGQHTRFSAVTCKMSRGTYKPRYFRTVVGNSKVHFDSSGR
ncbi:uncharacterized protein LOC132741514 isoform X2 [Ruditapes philippinarum]|uniref:uncharacterized protein LOC132741514 isoform X2 n=1 Tax=Ruditapes philippinarum TaxID=129788 RepID=UPI00295A71FC|nr:uncharacterized protein LOC132741514 isoform X2 [Ruditapes philippinarum]